MSDIELLHRINAAKALDLAVNALKISGSFEHALPGILIVPGHVVVCVIARDHHQRAENDFLITGFVNGFENSLAGCLFRLTLDGADKDILKAEVFHLRLHLAVCNFCGMCGAMTEEDKCRAVFFGSFDVGETGILQSGAYDRAGHDLFVNIDLGSIFSDLAEERLGDGH